MYILFEAFPAKNREFVTCSGRFHHRMETGAVPVDNAKRIYSFRAASIISNLLQPKDDPFQTY